MCRKSLCLVLFFVWALAGDLCANAVVGELEAEDFETGDFGKFPWQYDGHPGWAITSQEKYSGTYAARPGSIDHNESTTLQVTFDCVPGRISFYRKVSSESGYDYLKFYIDGAERGKWSGEEDWAEVSFPVREGTRTFRWTYSKDGSDSQGDDTAWIDDIVFPVISTAPWRSSLYPEDWRPGYKDSLGRFLHDFSYAGYRLMARTVPCASGTAGWYCAGPDPVKHFCSTTRPTCAASRSSSSGLLRADGSHGCPVPRWTLLPTLTIPHTLSPSPIPRDSGWASGWFCAATLQRSS